MQQLEAACQKGGTSFLTSGIDPGFANDLLPLTLTGFSERIDSVRVMEILNYDTYAQPEVLFETMGFGKPPDDTPLLLMPGVLTLAWGSVVHVIAAGLGVTLDEVRERHERWASDRKFETPGGVIEEGTMAGLRFEVIGVVNGREAIVVEHVTRMRDDAAPDWPQPSGKGSYRITVEGSPKMKCELELLGEDGDHNTGGVLATATRPQRHSGRGAQPRPACCRCSTCPSSPASTCCRSRAVSAHAEAARPGLGQHRAGARRCEHEASRGAGLTPGRLTGPARVIGTFSSRISSTARPGAPSVRSSESVSASAAPSVSTISRMNRAGSASARWSCTTSPAGTNTTQRRERPCRARRRTTAAGRPSPSTTPPATQ